MRIDFYIIVLLLAILFPAMLFFGYWWNERHGFDPDGNPIEPPHTPHRTSER